ncbi:hypothetical protein [Rubrivirga sp. IMCC45206]|uniref:hypothetical protein n=1 Tax=Rubrivirga sp. IMCC45206 TaxID=3391614 RepID=UPI00398FD713
MIFRRVLQHVQDQNWTAVGIDFVIVVVGVFLGLQVQEWSTERARAEQARADAVELREVAEEEMRELCAARSYYATTRLSADRALAMLHAAPGTDAELVVHAYRPTEAITFGRESGVYESIVSAGRLGAVEDEALTTSLLNVLGSDDLPRAYRDAHTAPYRVHIRRGMAHPVQEAIRARCSDDRSGEAVTLVSTCALDAPAGEVARAAAALREDAEAARLLAEHYSLLNIIVNNTAIAARLLADGLGLPDAVDPCPGRAPEPVLPVVTLAPGSP